MSRSKSNHRDDHNDHPDSDSDSDVSDISDVSDVNARRKNSTKKSRNRKIRTKFYNMEQIYKASKGRRKINNERVRNNDEELLESSINIVCPAQIGKNNVEDLVAFEHIICPALLMVSVSPYLLYCSLKYDNKCLLSLSILLFSYAVMIFMIYSEQLLEL